MMSFLGFFKLNFLLFVDVVMNCFPAYGFSPSG